MKYMFASDIHGSAYYCRKMLEAFEAEGASRLFLLGDLLYHGPRNDLPKEYAPKQVIAMLNEKKQYLTNVRGNCDAEVDQMVLEFPVLADYSILIEGGHTFYMSHGHIYNEQNLPPLMDGARCSIYYAYLLSGVPVLLLDGIVCLFFRAKKVRLWRNLVSFAVSAAVLTGFFQSGLLKTPGYDSGYVTNGARTCLTNIIKENEDETS